MYNAIKHTTIHSTDLLNPQNVKKNEKLKNNYIQIKPRYMVVVRKPGHFHEFITLPILKSQV